MTIQAIAHRLAVSYDLVKDFNGLSTGPLEGTNNKTKTLHKMAYGFRGVEFFKLKIMVLHETNYALVG